MECLDGMNLQCEACTVQLSMPCGACTLQCGMCISLHALCSMEHVLLSMSRVSESVRACVLAQLSYEALGATRFLASTFLAGGIITNFAKFFFTLEVLDKEKMF